MTLDGAPLTETDVLAIVLTAAVDLSISDGALRLALALSRAIVREAETSSGRKNRPYFISDRSLKRLAGVGDRLDDLLAEIDSAIGLVVRTSRGTPHVLADRRDHGIAGKYALSAPRLAPGVRVGSDNARWLWKLLDPSDERWSRRSRPWRLACRLLIEDVLEVDDPRPSRLDPQRIATLLGIDRRHASRVRNQLTSALIDGMVGVKAANGRREVAIDMRHGASSSSPSPHCGSVQAALREMDRRAAWVVERRAARGDTDAADGSDEAPSGQEPTGRAQAPQAACEPERPMQTSEESRARIERLRARVQGDQRPELERRLSIDQQDLDEALGRLRWRPDLAPDVERLRDRVAGLQQQIAGLPPCCGADL